MEHCLVRGFLSRALAPEKIQRLSDLVRARGSYFSGKRLSGPLGFSRFNFANAQTKLQGNRNLQSAIFPLDSQKEGADSYWKGLQVLHLI
jgi:hypothetical protein